MKYRIRSRTQPYSTRILVRHPDIDVTVLTSTQEQKDLVLSGLGPNLLQRTSLVESGYNKADRAFVGAVMLWPPRSRSRFSSGNLDTLAHSMCRGPRKATMPFAEKAVSAWIILKFCFERITVPGTVAVPRKNVYRETLISFLVAGKKDEKRHKEAWACSRRVNMLLPLSPKFRTLCPHERFVPKLFRHDNPVVSV